MKRLRNAGLALLVSVGCTAGTAAAQNAVYSMRPALLPLPSVNQASAPLVRAGYTSYDAYQAPALQPTPALPTPEQRPAAQPTPARTPADQFESAFATRTRAYQDDPAGEPTPAAPAPAPPASPGPMTEYEQALHDSCWDCADGHCGDGACCDGCCPDPHFFGTVGGIAITRTRGPAFTTTYQNGVNNGIPLMTTQNANAGWTGGGELTVGYAFGGADQTGPYGAASKCGGPAFAFTWWGTGEMNGFASVHQTTGVQATALTSSFVLTGATINGNPFTDYFVGAEEQRIWRSDIVNSAEANLLQGAMVEGGKLQIIGLLGFRYFRFSESLLFGSASFGNSFTSNGGSDAGYVGFNCYNNLYGLQLGSIFNYQVSPRWQIYVTPKAGVYANQMNVRNLLYSGNGTITYDFRTSKSDAAFLGQLDVGFNYLLRPNLYGYFGYRVVGVSNLALGDNQFQASFGDIKQSGSLILHGATFGLAWLL